MFGFTETKRLLFVCLVSFLFCTLILAQAESDPSETDPDLEAGVSTDYYQEGELAQLWNYYITVSKTADSVLKEQAFEEIREFKRSEGDPIMESASLLFLQKGNVGTSNGDYESARQDYLHAIQMNPFLWAAYVKLGELKTKEGKGWKTYVSMYLKGLTKSFNGNNTFYLLSFIDWFSGNLIWIICVSFFIFCLIVCLKYIHPHLYVFLSDKNKSSAKVVLAAVTLLLPLLLGFNFYLIAGTYLIIFFPFFSVTEKRNVFLASTILLIVPLLYSLQIATKSLQVDQEFKYRNKQFYLGDPERQVSELTDLLKKNHSDEFMFSLSVLQQKMGDYKGALESYDQISKSSEFWASGMVNRGNIYFMGNKFQEAIAAYKAARNVNESLPEVHFNLSAVNGALGKHMEAEKALIEARNLNSSAVENWEMMELSVANIEMAEIGGVASLFKSIEKAFSKTFKLKRPVINIWLFFLIVLFFSFIHSKLRNPRLLPKTCIKCGKIYYPSESPNSESCSQCVHIYHLKSDLPNEAKLLKHEEVKHFGRVRNRIAFWMHTILPGARGILSNASISGWLSLFTWICLLRFSFISISTLNYQGMTHLAGKDLLLYFIWGTTLVFWLIFGLRAAWQED